MSQLVETAFQVFNDKLGSGEKGATEDETGCSAGGCLDTGQCWTKLRSPTSDPAAGRISQVLMWDSTNVQIANSSHTGIECHILREAPEGGELWGKHHMPELTEKDSDQE